MPTSDVRCLITNFLLIIYSRIFCIIIKTEYNEIMRLLFTNPANAVRYGNSIVSNIRCEKKIFRFCVNCYYVNVSFIPSKQRMTLLPYELVWVYDESYGNGLWMIIMNVNLLLFLTNNNLIIEEADLLFFLFI